MSAQAMASDGWEETMRELHQWFAYDPWDLDFTSTALNVNFGHVRGPPNIGKTKRFPYELWSYLVKIGGMGKYSMGWYRRF